MKNINLNVSIDINDSENNNNINEIDIPFGKKPTIFLIASYFKKYISFIEYEHVKHLKYKQRSLK